MVSFFKEQKWISYSLILLIVGAIFNTPVQNFVMSIRNGSLDDIMLFITDAVFFTGIIFFLLYIFLDDTYFSKKDALSILASISLSLVFGTLSKNFFSLERPILEHPLTLASGYGFPSIHAAICTSVLTLLFLQKRKLFWWLLPIGIAICSSRIYIGVHYVSDVVGGVFLGTIVGNFIALYEQKLRLFERLVHFFQRELEARRQLAHLVFGVVIVSLLELRLLEREGLFLLLLVGIIISLYVKKRNIPLISTILHKMERSHHMTTLPGRGVLFFVGGSLLALFLFPFTIAKAAIIFLAVGDSLTHLVGKYWGRFPLPYNPHKFLEGPVVAWVASSLCMGYFVPLPAAFVAGFLGMTVETIPLKMLGIDLDDNLTLPLIVGFLLFLMMHT